MEKADCDPMGKWCHWSFKKPDIQRVHPASYGMIDVCVTPFSSLSRAPLRVWTLLALQPAFQATSFYPHYPRISAMIRRFVAAVAFLATSTWALKVTPGAASALFKQARGLVAAAVVAASTLPAPLPVVADGPARFEYQPALEGLDYGKPRSYYPDYVQKPSGLQYKVVKEGDGKSPKKGDKVSVDWEGYTIGYYGRPFQVRNKVKGGAFDSTQTDYFRWVVGSGTVVAALDEAVQYLKEGGVMQVIVPAELGYPQGDPDHDIVGPKPATFSGQRALNFVLDNKNLIDKTLLINIKLARVDNAKN